MFGQALGTDSGRHLEVVTPRFGSWPCLVQHDVPHILVVKTRKKGNVFLLISCNAFTYYGV